MMSTRAASKLDQYEDIINPLDNVEEVLSANNWHYTRAREDELAVTVTGNTGDYRLFFIWMEELSMMQFCCQYDIVIPDENYDAARNIMMETNEKLLLGHFDLPRDTSSPCFRQTCLLRGITNDTGFEHLEDLIDISLALCERHYSAFSLLSSATLADKKSINLALMETVGES